MKGRVSRDQGRIEVRELKAGPKVQTTRMASNNRTSTYTQVSTSSDHDRPKSSDAKKDMWSTMLDSVASGKRLPEKNILVLGMGAFKLPKTHTDHE